MKEEEQIINKVANSALITFNLEDYYEPGERILLDIKDQLYEGLILREKDFRDFIKNHDWTEYQDKFVAITCSADAIVPTWAYMLLAIALKPFAKRLIFGSLQELEIENFRQALSKIKWSDFKDAKVVVKGCSKVDVPVAIYVDVVNQLRPYAASLMFGEPCSTVPLFKKSKT
ncbi:MAG TPA: DUF2480 family protein [Chryseolinea sp.]